MLDNAAGAEHGLWGMCRDKLVENLGEEPAWLPKAELVDEAQKTQLDDGSGVNEEQQGAKDKLGSRRRRSKGKGGGKKKGKRRGKGGEL